MRIDPAIAAIIAITVMAVAVVCGPNPGPIPPIPPTTTTTTTTLPPPPPTTTMPPRQCDNPRPGPVTVIDVKVHIPGPNWTTVDASPLVGQFSGTSCVRDHAYCLLIGFDDGRGYCPPRAESDPMRGVCDFEITGGGIVWTWNDRVITPETPGVPPDHEARIDPVGGWMLQVKPAAVGIARACARVSSGCFKDGARMDCGQIALPR